MQKSIITPIPFKRHGLLLNTNVKVIFRSKSRTEDFPVARKNIVSIFFSFAFSYVFECMQVLKTDRPIFIKLSVLSDFDPNLIGFLFVLMTFSQFLIRN